MNRSLAGVFKTATAVIGMVASSVLLAVLLMQTPAMGQTAATPPAPPADAAAGLRFDPPPVPDFMLRKPAAPLSIEEMQKQADEAAGRVRGPVKPAPEPNAKPQP